MVFEDKIIQSDEGGRANFLNLSNGDLIEDSEIGKGWLSRPVVNGKSLGFLDSTGQFFLFRLP